MMTCGVKTMRSGLGGALLLAFIGMVFALAFGHAAQAQLQPTAQPPRVQMTDKNGIDLKSGQYAPALAKIDIGPKDDPALSYDLTPFFNASVSSGTPLLGYIYHDYCAQGATACFQLYHVRIGDKVIDFDPNTNCDCTSPTGDSWTNDSSGNFIVTEADGTIDKFPPSIYVNSPQNIGGEVYMGFISSIQHPDGRTLQFTYASTPAGQQSFATSVVSNLGYELHRDTSGSVYLINLANDFCAPSATTCGNFSVTWPRIVFSSGSSTSGGWTDALGRMTTNSLSGSTETITSPGGVAFSLTSAIITGPQTCPSVGPVFNKFQNAAGIWTFAYTVDGHCKILTNTSTDPLSNTKKYTFNSVNQQVITDEIGRSTTYGFTSLQNPNLYWQQEVLFSGQIYPRGASLGYTHDVRGNITTSTATPIAVSGQSQLSPTNVTAAFPSACTNSGITAATCNKPTSTTDARGNETDYTYDPNTGLMLTKTLPAGSNGIRPQTRYTYQQYQATYYNASGVMTQGTPVWKLQQTSTCQTQASCANTADEVRVTYTYDGNLRPSTVTTMAGDSSLVSTVTYGYDAVGDVVSVTKPAGSSGGTATTVYFYDVARQQIGEVGPDPDGSGPLHNRATRTTYDLDGRVTKVETGWTNSQSAADFANFTSLQQHSTSYDSLGRKILETTSAGGTTLTATQYSYDVMDRLICTAVRLTPATFGSLPALACTATAAGSIGADGPDQITFNSYDAAGQLLTSISGYGTSAPRTDKTETYNADGQELTVADANGNLTTWVYDGLDRVSQILYPTKTNGAVSSTSDYEQYGYDAQNNVTSDRRRDGTTITTTFDGLNRQITQALPNLPTVYTSYDLLGRTTAVTYNAFTGVGSGKSYDALGRLTSETSYGYTMSYLYDLAGDRTRVTWWDGNFVGYVFDLADEMTAVEENGAASGVGLLASYGYDDLGRVTAITRGNNVSTAYGYDGISRLTSLSHTMSGGNVQNQTYGLTYSSASQLRKVTASNSGYRWSGAATTLRAYGVNGQNQLTTSGGAQIAYDARGNLSSDSVTSYGYDVRNLLTSASGGASATLNNDPEGRLQSLTTGGAVTQFVYAGPNVAAEVNASGAILRRYAPGLAEDRPVVWYEGAGLTDRRWLLEDHQGSVVAVTNGTGGALAINSYDDYGAPGSGNLGRYQYTGQLWLPEVGLYDYKARDYSPTLGRFMQTDPIGYKDGLNWYEYVGDDPVDHTDPSGNCVEDLCIVEGGVAVTAAATFAVCYFACPKLSDAIGRAAGDVWDHIVHHDLNPDDLKDKTREQIRDMANKKGFVPHPNNDPNDPKKKEKFKDPKTGKERVRVDPGHKDPDTGKPYDNPNAAGDHVHGYEPDGSKIRDPATGDPHFPLKPSS